MNQSISRHALFSGLVYDEQGQLVETVFIGAEPHYVVLEGDFKRHIPAETVDRQVIEVIQQQAADADLLYAGDLVIDRGRAQVRRGQQLLSLTPTELRLLVYLAQNVGQALSRAQILDAVWGYDAEVESERIVNVHIRRLREKVELDPGRPSLILTVPGIGYRLAG